MDINKYRIFDGTGNHQLNLYNFEDAVMGRNGRLTLTDDNIKPQIIKPTSAYPLNVNFSYERVGNMLFVPNYQLPSLPEDFWRFDGIIISRVLAGVLTYYEHNLDWRIKDRLYLANVVYSSEGHPVGLVGLIPLFRPQDIDTYLEAPYNRDLSKIAVERAIFEYERSIFYSINQNEQAKLWQLKQLLNCL